MFLGDVKLKNGMLLVSRAYEVTASFIERIRNHADNFNGPDARARARGHAGRVSTALGRAMLARSMSEATNSS